VSRVDFYVLSQDGPDARLRIACRLVEKAYDQNIRVYVQTSSFADAQRLDDMLWTFNDRSFIPHEVMQGNAATHERVMALLGEAPPPSSHRQLLINLTNSLPADIESFDRIAEIVDVDPENKRLSRERYKAYRERGCELESHNL
jgi:DNA polymerase-3 subunit chi